jgi:hypothetical protein
VEYSVEQVIDGIGAALVRGEGALFLGSGISTPSGLPDWLGLMKNIANPLGLDLTSSDDLAKVAQYIINSDNGNRGPLVGRLRRTLLQGEIRQNDYHAAISRTNVATIWTTNFDTLLERVFATMRLAVRANDGDLTGGVRECDIELFKIHGCIDRSKTDELILTQEDYENFSATRPALTERLRHDLIHNSILFAGYSYRDPNIATVLVEARRLGSGATREHFFIAKRETDPASFIRQRLWHDDLRRFGIRTAFIDDYQDLTDALNRLALVSRGKSVFITGSHTTSNTAMAEQIGELLALDSDIVLLDGQSSGVGRAAANAFGTACVQKFRDIRGRIRYFSNPYAFNPKFSDDPSLLGTLKQWRASLARAAHVVVVFDGGMGTDAEVEVVREMDCVIVPVKGGIGGTADRLLSDPKITNRLSPSYVSKAKEGTAKAEDVAQCIVDYFSK